MMRGLKFSRPKGPGFGISGDYYLSILSTKATLPALLAFVNPYGEGGAVPGFGVPLSATADKKVLTHPIERGAYGLASKDRKTALKMLVIPTGEAGWDPEVVARHS